MFTGPLLTLMLASTFIWLKSIRPLLVLKTRCGHSEITCATSSSTRAQYVLPELKRRSGRSLTLRTVSDMQQALFMQRRHSRRRLHQGKAFQGHHHSTPRIRSAQDSRHHRCKDLELARSKIVGRRLIKAATMGPDAVIHCHSRLRKGLPDQTISHSNKASSHQDSSSHLASFWPSTSARHFWPRSSFPAARKATYVDTGSSPDTSTTPGPCVFQ